MTDGKTVPETSSSAQSGKSTDVKGDSKVTDTKSDPPASKVDKAYEAWQTARSKFPSGDNGLKEFGEFTKQFPLQDLVAPEKEKEKDKLSTKGADGLAEKTKNSSLNKAFQDNSKNEIGLSGRPAGYGATYLNADWNLKNIAGVDNPATLNGEAWRIIANTNKYLHGFVVGRDGSLSRARFAAFQLRENSDSSNKVPLNSGNKTGEAGTPKSLPNGTDTSPANTSNSPSFAFTPDFEVFDDSSVSIKESSTDLEYAFARNGFSSVSNQGGIGFDTPFVSGSASGGEKHESHTGTSGNDSRQTKQYTATYNFPRARIFLDAYNLEPTPSCLALLDSMAVLMPSFSSGNAGDSVLRQMLGLREEFYTKYGHIFSTRFQLGAQLYATKSATSMAHVAEDQRKEMMKWSLAVSLESKYVSANYSHDEEKGSSSQTKTSSVMSDSALAFEARGGNTLLCLNPAEWANSVAGFQTWRVFEQSGVVAIPKLIGSLPDPKIRPAGASLKLAQVPHMFSTILEITDNSSALPWRNKFRLEASNGRRVVLRDGKLCLSSNPNDQTMIFKALDASIKSKELDPTMKSLQELYPLFLTAGDQNIIRNTDGQIQGIWFDDYYLGPPAKDNVIYSWSFSRLGGDLENRMNLDKPLSPGQVINSGDKVLLRCHSSQGFGPYIDPSSPPWAAGEVCTINDDVLTVFSLSNIEYQHFTTKIDGQDVNLSDVLDKKHPDLWPLSPSGLNLSTIQEKYDRGVLHAGDQELATLMAFRDLYGVKNEANVKAFAAKYYDPKFGGSGSQTVDQAVKRLQAIVPAALNFQRNDWARIQDAKDPVTFTIVFEG